MQVPPPHTSNTKAVEHFLSGVTDSMLLPILARGTGQQQGPDAPLPAGGLNQAVGWAAALASSLQDAVVMVPPLAVFVAGVRQARQRQEAAVDRDMQELQRSDNQDDDAAAPGGGQGARSERKNDPMS